MRTGWNVRRSLRKLGIKGRERVGEVEVGSGPGTDTQLPAFLLCPLPPQSCPPVLLTNTVAEQMAVIEIVKKSH